VVTGSRTCKLEAVHIIGAADGERLLKRGSGAAPAVSDALKRFLTSDDMVPDPKDATRTVLAGDVVIQLPRDIRHPYDARLAILCNALFNYRFMSGRCWVTPDAAGRMRIHFLPELLDPKHEKFDPLAVEAEGKELRKPTDPKQLELWPPDNVWACQAAMAPLLALQRADNAEPTKSPSASAAAARASGAAADDEHSAAEPKKKKRKLNPCTNQPCKGHSVKGCSNEVCTACCTNLSAPNRRDNGAPLRPCAKHDILSR